MKTTDNPVGKLVAGQRFRLVRYFTLTSLAMFVLVALALTHFLRQQGSLLQSMQGQEAEFFRQVQQSFAKQQDAALVLVGAGRLMDPLKAQAERLGIGSQVIFVGASDAVERYMALADFGLLTSNAEGLSNTLLEYMASGLPVIGSRISGTEDFVASGKTGWLFTAGDTHQFKDCLHAAAQARANLAELGQNARRHVVAQASIGAVVNRLLSLYKLQLVG